MRSVAVIFFWALNSLALAWGPEGHAVIAEIAQGQLKPETLAKIDAIRHARFDLGSIHPNETDLGYKTDEGLDRFASDQGLDLADIASWADGIRHRRGFERTASWHFINVPVREELTETDIPSLCLGWNCLAAQLEEQFRVLKDGSSEPLQRFEALCYVVHLVGDIHQPLHCADNGDEGGNQSPVRFFGRQGREIQLHSLWDDLVIAKYRDENKLGTSVDLKNDVLSHTLPGDLVPQQDLDYVSWAFESYQIARTRIYPAYHGPLTGYGQPYVEEMMPLIEGQLAKAGLRLAYVLEQALGGSESADPSAGASAGNDTSAEWSGAAGYKRPQRELEISKFFRLRTKYPPAKSRKVQEEEGIEAVLNKKAGTKAAKGSRGNAVDRKTPVGTGSSDE